MEWSPAIITNGTGIDRKPTRFFKKGDNCRNVFSAAVTHDGFVAILHHSTDTAITANTKTLSLLLLVIAAIQTQTNAHFQGHV